MNLDGLGVDQETIKTGRRLGSTVRSGKDNVGDTTAEAIGAISEFDTLDRSYGVDKVFLFEESRAVSYPKRWNGEWSAARSSGVADIRGTCPLLNRHKRANSEQAMSVIQPRVQVPRVTASNIESPKTITKPTEPTVAEVLL